MAIFKLKHAGVTLTIRAACVTCARNVAATNAGQEGPRAWRDSTLSSLEVVRNNIGFDPTGPTTILKRDEVTA